MKNINFAFSWYCAQISIAAVTQTYIYYKYKFSLINTKRKKNFGRIPDKL